MDEQVTHPKPQARPVAPRVPAGERPPVRRRYGLFVLLLALLAAGVLAWRVLAPGPAPAPQGRGAALPPQPVGVATAARGDIRIQLDAIGTVTPLATVTVRTQIAGQMQEVGFTEGQIVHKGDFLAQIDPRPYQALLEQYQGQFARDQALMKQAQVDLVRYQTLLRQDSIARQQAEDQVFLVQQYQAAMRSDQAQIDQQKLNLIYCHITSPVDGRVGLRLVDPGNFVQPSDANGLVVVTELQPMSVILPLPEDNLPQVLPRFHAGEQLQVTAYDRANVTKLATGVLSTIDNQVDTTTGTWKLRALFDNKDEMLFPNQFVNARLLVETRHDVVTVPTAAVQRGAPGAYVYVVRPDDTVAMRPVQTGPVDGEREQIVSGLDAGDRVVVDGTDRLRDGARVIARAENGAPGHAKRD
ncbi:MAG: efflux RND transporter periplasmic adaptor subunit [Rhodospirillales bacterium]|nr:efflux RND transporter periplasmic adaptor subunit [Rhodospirillales bacterium]